MRGKNRKPIASCLKLPQFTTMNVIDGQAGLVLYSSLIFYSLTINNILNIIVLLIFAGISIQMLVGEGGILQNAREAKDKTGEADAREELNMYLMEYSGNKSLGDTTDLKTFLESKGYTVEVRDDGKLEVEKDGYKFIVDPDTLSVTLKEKGKPEIKVDVGEATEEEKITITVTVTNEDELGNIDSVTLTTPNGDILQGTVTEGVATFEVDENGTYTVEVKATTDGTQKSTKQDVKVDKITAKIDTTLDYGTIDVIWVDENNNIQDKPESPSEHLYNNTMKKVTWTWNEDTKKWTENDTEPTKDEDWYSYNALDDTSKDDNLTSHWANAKNMEDESYFVWIPRYAYRITYYENEQSYIDGAEPLAYFDGNGLVDKKGARITNLFGYSIENGNKMDEKIQTVTKDGKSYIVHPAFYGPGSEDLGGGFGTNEKGIAGIWVAKYEMSQEGSYDSGKTWDFRETTYRGGGSILTTKAGGKYPYPIRAVSKPATEEKEIKCWRWSNIANSYTNSYYYDRNKESHLIKNSEWGAVAYLTHSQYGRNGYEITINNSTFYPGMAGDYVSAGNDSDVHHFYNTTKGGLASTTGNIYGVYDMSGGAYEYTAIYAKDYKGDYFTGSKYYLDENGNNFANEAQNNPNGSSTKYATAYNGINSDDKLTVRYKEGKVGDAVKEVMTSTETAWFSDTRTAIYLGTPFNARGGMRASGEKRWNFQWSGY